MHLLRSGNVSSVFSLNYILNLKFGSSFTFVAYKVRSNKQTEALLQAGDQEWEYLSWSSTDQSLSMKYYADTDRKVND